MNIRLQVQSWAEEKGRALRAEELKDKGLSLYGLYRAIPEGLPAFYKSIGYTLVSSAWRWDKQSLRDYVLDKIKEEKRFCSAYYISKAYNISRASLRKFDLDIDQLNEEAGFTRGSKKPMPSFKTPFKEDKDLRYKRAGSLTKDRSLREANLLAKVRKALKESEVYLPQSAVSAEVGVSASLLSYYGIDTVAENNAVGLHQNNRYFEYSVGEVLELIFPSKVTRQHSFPDCLSAKGHRLYFDFFIEEHNLLIEADGPGHDNTEHPWYTEEGKYRDFLKEEYCKRKGYFLCRIPYESNVTQDYVKHKLSEIPLESLRLQRTEKSEA